MHFLAFPPEIRLEIYAEVLVGDDYVWFQTKQGPRSLRLVRVDTQRLTPGLLRVNKLVNREATPILYEQNRFRFPGSWTPLGDHVRTFRLYRWLWSDVPNCVPNIVPFLRQIGDKATLLQHICIRFPERATGSMQDRLSPRYALVLQIIRLACPNLKTIEFLYAPQSVNDFYWAAKQLSLLDDCGLKKMPSLEKIVSAHWAELPPDEESSAFRDSLMQRLPNSKWTVELTDLPREEEVEVEVEVDDAVRARWFELGMFDDDEYDFNASIGGAKQHKGEEIHNREERQQKDLESWEQKFFESLQ